MKIFDLSLGPSMPLQSTLQIVQAPFLLVLKIRRPTQRLYTGSPSALVQMIKSTLQTTAVWRKFEMHCSSNTRRSCRQLKDSIWQSSLTTRCWSTHSSMRHELILASLIERLLPHSLTWMISLSLSDVFKCFFKHYWRSTLSFVTQLMLKTIPTLSEIFKSFKRKRHNWRLWRLHCGLNHRERTSKEFSMLSDEICDITDDHQTQTVTISHITSLHAAISVMTPIACMTVNISLLLTSKLSQRDWSNQWWKFPMPSMTNSKGHLRRPVMNKREENTEHMMLRSTRRVTLSSQNQALRMRMNQMRKLLLCLRRSSVRSLDLIELQTLMSSHIWLISFNSSEILWCEYAESPSRSEEKDYMLTTAAQSQCKIRLKISYFCTTFSMFQSLGSIYCQKSECARKVCKKALTIMSYTCMTRMASLWLRHLGKAVSM